MCEDVLSVEIPVVKYSKLKYELPALFRACVNRPVMQVTWARKFHLAK